MRRFDSIDWRQYFAASVLLALAIVRMVWPTLGYQLDEIPLVLIGLALALVLVPLRKITSLKAGGFELTLESPQVNAAVNSLGLDRIESEALRRGLGRLSYLLPQVRGARVLWIDDRPEKVVGERRLLRALGVDVTSAISSDRAREILSEDNDFDLILTDVQRAGETYRITGGVEIHEGVNFICWLRSDHPDRVVRDLPVVFYAAYDWPRLTQFTRPARELLPESQISNSVSDLIPKVLSTLTDRRAEPIHAPEMKIPTGVRKKT